MYAIKKQRASRAEVAALGERAAEKELIQQGYEIVSKNFRWRGGEIDLIVRRENLIAFVEVKTRQAEHLPYIADMVPYSKQRRIIQTARYFCACHPRESMQCVLRFDVVYIRLLADSFQMSYIADAFRIPE